MVYFRNLLQPFVLAIIVWYLIRGIRELIGRIRIKNSSLPRWIRTILALLITFGLLWLIVELISYNVTLIIEKSSGYNQNLKAFIKTLTDISGIENVDKFLREQVSKIDLQQYATDLLNTVSGILGNAALILIYTIFLLIEENFIPSKIKNFLEASNNKETVYDIIKRITRSINTYFTVKVIVSLLTGVLSYIVLAIIGVDFAVLWAFLIFLFNFIPYVGSLIATLLPAFFAIFQFASFIPFLWVLIGVEAIQIFVGSYLEPRIMGKSLNLSPLIVILSLAFWGAIWGVVGMLLSVPIISVLTIVMAHFPETKKVAILFSEKGNVDSYIEK
jgi:predicted PurR-regulated permease PerM